MESRSSKITWPQALLRGGTEQKNANASIVFVGNVNQSVESLLKTSNLFSPFPEAMNSDTAFFDRMHYYLLGWEIPKFRPEHFTDRYGFIVDYIAEFFRACLKIQPDPVGEVLQLVKYCDLTIGIGLHI